MLAHFLSLVSRVSFLFFFLLNLESWNWLRSLIVRMFLTRPLELLLMAAVTPALTTGQHTVYRSCLTCPKAGRNLSMVLEDTMTQSGWYSKPWSALPRPLPPLWDSGWWPPSRSSSSNSSSGSPPSSDRCDPGAGPEAATGDRRMDGWRRCQSPRAVSELRLPHLRPGDVKSVPDR